MDNILRLGVTRARAIAVKLAIGSGSSMAMDTSREQYSLLRERLAPSLKQL